MPRIVTFYSDIDEPRTRPLRIITPSQETDGDDMPGGGGPPYVVTVNRYQGPINYCGFAEFITPFGFAPKLYAVYGVQGQNRSRFGVSPGCPDINTCEPYTGNLRGVSQSTFSGQVVTNPADCTQTGALQVSFEAEGQLPHTSWMQQADGFGNPYVTQSTSFQGLLAQLPGWIIFHNVDTGPKTRTHYTNADVFGCFILQGPGYGSGCPGYAATETLGTEISPADLGYPIFDHLPSQHIVSYDSGTRQFTGFLNEIVANVFFPAGKTEVTLDISYLIDDGVTQTAYNETHRLQGTPGQYNQFPIAFPRVIGQDVVYQSGIVSYSDEVYDDFSTYLGSGQFSDFFPYLPAIGSWNREARFVCPAPNSFCGSDFSDFVFNDTNVVSSLSAGYYWADNGRFLSADPTEASDNFESYPLGPRGNLPYGIGWVIPGYIIRDEPNSAYDDFESYPLGSIAEIPALPPAPSNDNRWSSQAGRFVVFDYDQASDDFEGYSIGSITVLNYGDGWNQDGRFI